MDDDAMEKSRPPLSRARRHWLGLCAAAAASASTLAANGCSSLDSGAIPGKRARDFIIHDSTNWESRPATIGNELITPVRHLYVCNHRPLPPDEFIADRHRWQLEVRGVNQAGSLSVGDLMKLGNTSLAMVLQCAGNGRKFFDHGTGGPAWGVGASGCVVWTGVPVSRVVNTLGGIKGSARYATATGGEPLNELVDEMFSMRVERSIPLAKALQDCLLAWDLNGKPIPLAHGGPLRLVVPGYYGINQVKYLKRLQFSDHQSDADIMQKEYRLVAVGKTGSADHPTTWAMPAKSWIWPPSRSPMSTGSQLHGVAFSGTVPADQVAISIDDGRNWHPVPLIDNDLGNYAWRRFSFPLHLPTGTYRVASRTVDSQGRRQPEWHNDNAGGYGNASWRDYAVTVTIA